MTGSYDPTVFNTYTLDDAKAIILTPEAGMTTEDRWRRETDDLEARLFIRHDARGARWLDYGCGIGRMSKVLLRYAEAVVGADISPAMLDLAKNYVNDPVRFFTTTPDRLSAGQPHAYDGIIAFWVLQHVKDPEIDIRRLWRALKPDGRLYVLNRRNRCVPVVGGWHDDGKDIAAELNRGFFQRRVFEQLGPPVYEPGSEFSIWERVG